MQLQEFLHDLNARISASKTTGFWSKDDKKRWINTAIIRACNYAPWNFLLHHSTHLTEKDKANHFNPFDYKPGGMILVKVSDIEYTKVSLARFHDADTTNVFTIIGDEYHLKPTPDTDDLVIDLYYRRRPVPLVEDTDEPITPQEMDEPIVKIALGICLKKLPNRKGDGDKEIAEAIALLQEIKDREDEEPGEMGYAGRATSTRFINKPPNYGT